MRLIFAGAGEFGLRTLAALIEARHEIVQVVTQPDRPAGRGRALTPTAIASLAVSRNLPLVKSANINQEIFPAADLMIVIAFGQKIAPHVVDHPRLGSVNLHASILPKYRGAAPINWAIINGERCSGNTIIRLAQRMDAGTMLMQSRVKIGHLETAGELHDRLAQDGAALMTDFLEALEADDDDAIVEVPQDESAATLAPKLSRDAAQIDWSRSDTAIANQVRGMYPWPACRVRLLNQNGAEVARVTLCRAKAGDAAWQRVSPGLIDDAGNVGAGGGTVVQILELQPEGKRPMSLQAFRNGHRWESGMRVESIL